MTIDQYFRYCQSSRQTPGTPSLSSKFSMTTSELMVNYQTILKQMYLYTNNNDDDKQKGTMTTYIRYHSTECPRKKYLSGILEDYGLFWLFWTIRAFLDSSGPFGTILTVLTILDYMDNSGQSKTVQNDPKPEISEKRFFFLGHPEWTKPV